MTEILNQIHDFLRPLLGLGLEPKELTAFQVSLRALIVFVLAIAVVRVADKRFLSRKTAFDVVLGLILASVLARAVNGSAPMLPTVIASFVLVLAHRLLAMLSCRWHAIGKLVKGNDDTIIVNGHLDEDALAKHNFSKRDLMEDLRLEGVDKIEDVQSARLERSGDISVIKKQN
jgi:uncharacterized membrane protein YcaP (DUF421 family)